MERYVPKGYLKTLEYFGITENPKARYIYATNRKKSFKRLQYLPNTLADMKDKKLRVTFYYDPEFPNTIIEITSDDQLYQSKSNLPEGEMS